MPPDNLEPDAASVPRTKEETAASAIEEETTSTMVFETPADTNTTFASSASKDTLATFATDASSMVAHPESSGGKNDTGADVSLMPGWEQHSLLDGGSSSGGDLAGSDPIVGASDGATSNNLPSVPRTPERKPITDTPSSPWQELEPRSSLEDMASLVGDLSAHAAAASATHNGALDSMGPASRAAAVASAGGSRNSTRRPTPRNDDDGNAGANGEMMLLGRRYSDLAPLLPPSPDKVDEASPSPPTTPSTEFDPFSVDSDSSSSHTPTVLYAFTSTSHTGRLLSRLSATFVSPHRRNIHDGSALAGFFALLFVTCANYVLGPMRDAAALAVGVSHIPALTLASTVLALGSSVPVGWLFEAPDPRRKRLWGRMGLTRGETQGTSLALFYRVFAFLLLTYAAGFWMVDMGRRNDDSGGGGGDSKAGKASSDVEETESILALAGAILWRLAIGMGIPLDSMAARFSESFGTDFFPLSTSSSHRHESIPTLFLSALTLLVNKSGKVIYIMFFLVVHLMKLHSLSLVWGVTTEAMEYEEAAEKRMADREMAREMSRSSLGGSNSNSSGHDRSQAGESGVPKPSKSALRLKRLAFVGFGGTLGGIIGSLIASFTAHILHLSGLLVVAAILIELSANLSIELGRIMQRHWEEQHLYQSSGDLCALANNASGGGAVDSSIKKSASMGSMKRVASGNLQRVASGNLQQPPLVRRATTNGCGDHGGRMTRAKSSGTLGFGTGDKSTAASGAGGPATTTKEVDQPMIDDNSFKQRLLRGVTTILRSRLLMSIFTYNALYASTSVLLSFQRAELVANRKSIVSSSSMAEADTAFLAKINTASSVAVFALQASGLGAYIANSCGQRGSLALTPIIRLCGVILLGYWHLTRDGRPPDLYLFLVIDEFTKVINFAVAKPVRESLWRGLSAEARYEAKPIVDTLANRWGGGSAAFLVSFINRIMDVTSLGVVGVDGERTILGFPPVILLCMIIATWWTVVSADVGTIRKKIDQELKKQQ